MPANKTADPFDLALSQARQIVYRFIAMSLFDPKSGCWEPLSSARHHDLLHEAAAFIRQQPEAQSSALGLGELPLAQLDPTAVLAQLPATQAEMNKHFEETFGLLVANACPPYETEYIHSKLTFQRSNALADISGFYRAFGLETSAQKPERPDHIVQELEFMAFLIGLTVRAYGGEPSLRNERLQVCQDAQASFLREHLSWWVPAFATLLSREDDGGFYSAVGNFLAAMIASERALFDLPLPSELAAPSEIARPDSCEGCLIQS
jgi:TorA maturation chaperone TorD